MLSTDTYIHMCTYQISTVKLYSKKRIFTPALHVKNSFMILNYPMHCKLFEVFFLLSDGSNMTSGTEWSWPAVHSGISRSMTSFANNFTTAQHASDESPVDEFQIFENIYSAVTRLQPVARREVLYATQSHSCNANLSECQLQQQLN